MSNQPQLDNEKQKKFAINARTVVIFLICVAGLLFIAQFDAIKNVVGWVAGMLSPVIVGTILAYIINPLTVIFENVFMRIFKKVNKKSRKRLSRGISIILSLIVLIAVIALLIFLIIPEFLESLNKLISKAPDLFENVLAWISDIQNSDNAFMANMGQSIDQLVVKLSDWLVGIASTAVGSLIDSVISVFSFFFDFIVALVVFVYALLEKEKFIAQSKKLIFAIFSRERANDILLVARYGNETFGKFISGKLLTSTVVGIVTFTFMSIMKMPYPLLSAGIIAITNVIPFFGPFIGGLPTSFIVLISDFRQGIIYIIFLLVLQQLEGNVIEPMIMEDKTGVSKFWIIFAILLCGGVFGIAGMIFAVPLFAVLFYSIKLGVERSLAKKDLPLSSDDYRNAGGVDIESNEIYPAPAKASRKKLSDAIHEWRQRLKDEDGSTEDE